MSLMLGSFFKSPDGINYFFIFRYKLYRILRIYVNHK